MDKEYGITPANIVTLEQTIDSVLLGSPSGDDIRALVVRIKTAEDLLRTFKKTGEVVKRFCEMHCRMLVRIVEEGYVQHLDDKDKKVARWIADMPKEKREELCKWCGDRGVSVSYYFTRAEKDNRLSAKMDKLNSAASDLIDGYREDGHVEATVENLIKVADLRDCKENRNIASYALSAVPTKLKRLGAISAGNGVYVNPESRSAHEHSKEIIANRMVQLVEYAGEISKLLWQLDVDIAEIGTGSSRAVSDFNKVKHLAIPMIITYDEIRLKQ